jgi:aspartate aminotransferase
MLHKTFGKLAKLVEHPQRTFSLWANVPLGPPDPILGVTEAFKKDTASSKVSLGAGTYRDDNNKPYILECVRKAVQVIQSKNLDYEYLPVEGLQGFINASSTLAYGDNSAAIKEKRVVGIQALSGTGSIRLGSAFIKRFLPGVVVYIPEVTWPNHRNILRDSGVEFKNYKYYNPQTKGLNIDGLLSDIKAAPNGSVFLLHASAHNPSGVDPKPEQWLKIREAILQKKHLAFFDMAYQGFTSGDPARDAFAVRSFVEGNVPVILGQSFAKNFGLYGLRTGLFSVILDNPKQFEAVQSQLKILARPIWSNPPLTGARIVDTVLHDKELNALWHKEVKMMADRIASMRIALVDSLKKLGSPHNWQHITDQIGMFAFTGLNEEQVKTLTQKHHIYLTADGRISIAGLNTKNVEYVAQAFHDVTKSSKL